VEFTVQELAALIGGQFASEADAGRKIHGAAGIADAGEGDVTFYGNV
jgi:UDP-3-O-[3-hydroxymyristoyl] glucosamine N-acyltransferase